MASKHVDIEVRSERHTISRTENNISDVHAVVRGIRRITILELLDDVQISEGSV